MNWNKVEDSLPELHYISDIWYISNVVLALVEGKYPVLSTLNSRDNTIEWLYSGRGRVTHWQYIEIPNANET